MASAITQLGSITVSATGYTNYTFSSISSAYKDLYVVFTGKAGTGANQPLVRLNGDSSNIYLSGWIYGNGAAAYSSANTGTGVYLCGQSMNLDTTYVFNANFTIHDYTATDKHKQMLGRFGQYNNAGSGVIVGRYPSTSAITSLSIYGDLSVGTTIILYGVNG